MERKERVSVLIPLCVQTLVCLALCMLIPLCSHSPCARSPVSSCLHVLIPLFIHTPCAFVLPCTHTSIYSYPGALILPCTHTPMYSYPHVLIPHALIPSCAHSPMCRCGRHLVQMPRRMVFRTHRMPCLPTWWSVCGTTSM